MNKKKLFAISAFLTVTTIVNAHSQNVQFGKPITTPVTITSSKDKTLLNSKKEVTLIPIQLTEKQKQIFLNFKNKKGLIKSTTSSLPATVDLGMNNVPVLNQGYHGSCVTFALTAAIDAALGKGDYISQLCQLELGSYLQYKGYLMSGWSGTWARQVYDQMLRFGIVSKKDIQKMQGCAGVKEYPVKSLNEGNIMTPEEYRYVSEDISEFIYPLTHMDIIGRLENGENQEVVERTFNNIKTALAKGDRITFGTILMLVMNPDCEAGACVTYKGKHDTWALSNEVENGGAMPAGHAMIITGYDDNATVTEKNGKSHKGLFMLRNSWGADVGDKGNYYMTYEYFKQFFLEAHEVVVNKDDNSIAYTNK